MLQFHISQELFDQDVVVSTSCKFLPDMFKMPFRLACELLEDYKKRMTRTAITELVRRMSVQRYESLSRSQHLREDQLKAHQAIMAAINYYRTDKEDVLNGVLKNIFIPNLEVLRPGRDSRYFANYEEKLNELKKQIF